MRHFAANSELQFEVSAEMIALGTRLVSAFGANQRPSADEARGHVSEWRLSMEHSLQIGVRIGDTLHINHGTVWLGADALVEPITLCEGATYTASSDAVLHMTGIDDPRVTVRSGMPLMVSARADYGAWRHRSPITDRWPMRAC